MIDRNKKPAVGYSDFYKGNAKVPNKNSMMNIESEKEADTPDTMAERRKQAIRRRLQNKKKAG